MSSSGQKEKVTQEAESGDAVERGGRSRRARSRRRARHLSEEQEQERRLGGEQQEGLTSLRTCLKKGDASPLNMQSVEEAGEVNSLYNPNQFPNAVPGNCYRDSFNARMLLLALT